ncbi:MAG: hypothetical protein ACRDPM_24510 [Solirubrobacteraceae bacterium]
MSVQLHTHHIRPRFTGLLAATVTAGGIATAALTIGIGSQMPTVAQAASIRTLSLSQRVLPSAALRGFVAPDHPAAVRGALTWATKVEGAATPMREAARLRHIGFIGGVAEQLHGRFPLAAEAVSTVERFHSAAGARAEFSYQSSRAVAGATGHQVTARLTAMPGAFGWVDRSSQLTAINVMFTSGAYVYVVGSAAAPDAAGAPTRQQIVADAQFLNLMVNGCVRTTHTVSARRPVAAQTDDASPMLLY